MGRKVGVISHVQEMTKRIATKVLVERVAGGVVGWRSDEMDAASALTFLVSIVG